MPMNINHNLPRAAMAGMGDAPLPTVGMATPNAVIGRVSQYLNSRPAQAGAGEPAPGAAGAGFLPGNTDPRLGARTA